uniref:Uncharacterized protein n=1 Tax=Caenorhabditis japonica TaxID=281687 RepID=A0A8R1EAE3_CAEJA
MKNNNSRLEALLILSNRNKLNRNAILGGFETKEWDSSERAGTYVNKTRFLYDCSAIDLENMNIPWESGDLDIVREDGMLATIRANENNFLFLVWHDRFPN